MTLAWLKYTNYEDADVGNYAGGDGVRFTLSHHPSCHRRGAWRLLIAVTTGPKHHLWGCFDDEDQPLRYYHLESSARIEAQAIADVLLAERSDVEHA